jgi:hypothetical protein
VCLHRASQPLTGIRDKFGVEDDMLLVSMQDGVRHAIRHQQLDELSRAKTHNTKSRRATTHTNTQSHSHTAQPHTQTSTHTGSTGGADAGAGAGAAVDEDVFSLCFHDEVEEDLSNGGGAIGCMHSNDDTWTSISVYPRTNEDDGGADSDEEEARVSEPAPPPPRVRTVEENIALAASTQSYTSPVTVNNNPPSTVTTSANTHAPMQQTDSGGGGVTTHTVTPTFTSSTTTVSPRTPANTQPIQTQPTQTQTQTQTHTQVAQPVPPQQQPQPPLTHMLRIIDCRALLSAQGNVIMGKGFENVNRHSLGCVSITFEGIGNIHTMKDSYRSLRCVCARAMAVRRHEWAEVMSVHTLTRPEYDVMMCANKQIQAPSTSGASYLKDLSDTLWLQHISDVSNASFVFVSVCVRVRLRALLVCACVETFLRTVAIANLAFGIISLTNAARRWCLPRTVLLPTQLCR